jgi:CDP-glycerol glycerophosphotransferase (TagB/SpsB family)
VQLWHGGSVKGKVGPGRLRGVPLVQKIVERLSLPGVFQRFDFFATYSSYSAQTFPKKNFNIPTERTLITGAPRYDVFFRDVPGAEIDVHEPLREKLVEIRAEKPKKIILYAPTFRRGKASKSPFSKLDLNMLQDFAERMDYFFVISLHPKYASLKWAAEGTFSRIFFCSPSYDRLPLLRQFDMLITDYSSCFIDFLLLNKPTVFFTYDLEEYRKDPGIDEKFWNFIPGPRVETISALLHALEQPDEFIKEREQARDTFFAYKDGSASERIANAILKNMSGLNQQ